MTVDEKIAAVNPFYQSKRLARKIKKHKTEIAVTAAIAGSTAVWVVALKKMADAANQNVNG